MECQRWMRYNPAMVRNGMRGAMILLAGLGCAQGSWVRIPAGKASGGEVQAFQMGRYEVTVKEFTQYLNAEGVPDFPETAQVARLRRGGYRARRGMRRQAVAEVRHAEAEAYTRWLGRRLQCVARLPTETEWEHAARGGLDETPYPWGWGGKSAKLARFDADSPAGRVGAYRPNGYGLHDMAGNLYEWCAAEATPAGQSFRVARGGAWSESDPARLRVDHRELFSEGYRGRDVGFRVLLEAADGGKTP